MLVFDEYSFSFNHKSLFTEFEIAVLVFKPLFFIVSPQNHSIISFKLLQLLVVCATIYLR